MIIESSKLNEIRYMPLAVGDRSWPYGVLAKIGAGGMGEVSRARDTRLKREFAGAMYGLVESGGTRSTGWQQLNVRRARAETD
jgi:hypothetical protein